MEKAKGYAQTYRLVIQALNEKNYGEDILEELSSRETYLQQSTEVNIDKKPEMLNLAQKLFTLPFKQVQFIMYHLVPKTLDNNLTEMEINILREFISWVMLLTDKNTHEPKFQEQLKAMGDEDNDIPDSELGEIDPLNPIDILTKKGFTQVMLEEFSNAHPFAKIELFFPILLFHLLGNYQKSEDKEKIEKDACHILSLLEPAIKEMVKLDFLELGFIVHNVPMLDYWLALVYYGMHLGGEIFTITSNLIGLLPNDSIFCAHKSECMVDLATAEFIFGNEDKADLIINETLELQNSFPAIKEGVVPKKTFKRLKALVMAKAADQKRIGNPFKNNLWK